MSLEQKKNSIFFGHLKDNFITKKQALTFGILNAFMYVCIVKNRYFEFCHIHDFYIAWKGLMFI